MLTTVIVEALPNPHDSEAERLSFFMKIDLAISLAMIRRDSRPAFVSFNKLRNRFAHRPEARFFADDSLDFFNLLSAFQKDALRTDIEASQNDPKEFLRAVIAIMFIECEIAINRKRYTKVEAEAMHEIVREVLERKHLPDGTPANQRVKERANKKFQERYPEL